jgi:hypothetical protein
MSQIPRLFQTTLKGAVHKECKTETDYDYKKNRSFIVKTGKN